MNHVAIGYNALNALTTGSNNIAIGSNAIGYNEACNIAIGYNYSFKLIINMQTINRRSC